MRIVVDRKWRSVTVDGRECHLTNTEFTLVELLATRGGYVSTYDLAVIALIGITDVKVYMLRIRRKLGHDAIVNLHGFGYALARGSVVAE